MSDDEKRADTVAQDPELRTFLAYLGYTEALSKLVAQVEYAKRELKKLEAPRLGPDKSLQFYRRYYERECEKAQLRVDLFELPGEIAALEQDYKVSLSPEVRRQYEERIPVPTLGSVRNVPDPPEIEARRKLDYAIDSQKVKQSRLEQLTAHDAEWDALLKSTPAPRAKTKAPPRPATISPVGHSYIPSKPRPAEVPTDFPPAFPASLRLQASVMLRETVKSFDCSKVEDLCRALVSNFTEMLCGAVRQGTLDGHEAPDRLNELLHYVRVANCDNDNERFRVEKAVINSQEWYSLLTRLAASENGAFAPEHENRKRIDAFIETLREAGYPVRRKDIALIAGYEKDQSELQRFQRKDPRLTEAGKRNFNRVLAMSVQDFMAALCKRKSLK